MRIKKSSRHSKLTGDFAEHLVLYWLSKYGFECARVDHTGIDLIARNPKTKERMGISVKARCRSEGAKSESLRIDRDGMEAAKRACQVFGCEPYLAIVVDAGNLIRCFILSFATYYRMYPKARRRAVNWFMGAKWRTLYDSMPDVKKFEFTSTTRQWW